MDDFDYNDPVEIEYAKAFIKARSARDMELEIELNQALLEYRRLYKLDPEETA